MTRTTELIDMLAADANPVRRLRPPAVRAACWLLFAVAIMFFVGIAHGLRADIALKLGQPRFIVVVCAAITSGVLAAVATFIASVPGMSRRWLLLPVPATIIWFGAIGYGCLTDWVNIGPDGISLGETARCFATLGLVGMPLSFMMLIMLRHLARLSPTPVVMVGSLSVAAMTATALSILHPLDATVMILLWNAGLATLLLWSSRKYSQRLVEWLGARY